MRKIISIQIFYCLCCIAIHAQPKPFFWGNDIITLHTDRNNFQTIVYGTKNGLPSSEISCLTQDSKGYVWVGTSAGLSRYDGLKFENFLKADGHFTGKIYAVREDSIRNIIWIACDAGLGYFKNNELRLVNFKENNITVYDIYCGENNKMCIGTGNGPAFFPGEIIPGLLSGKVASLQSFLLPQWNPPGIYGKSVYKINKSESGKFYFAGKGAIYLYHNNKIEQIWASQNQQNDNDDVVGIVPGNADTVFFASVFSGSYMIKDKELIKIPDDGIASGDIIKHNGDIYYFTVGSIYKFNSPKQAWEKISEVSGPFNLWISCLLVDNENNLWVGMHDNLFYQKPKIFFTFQSNAGAEEPELYSVAQLKNNQLLFGTNRGKVYERDGSVFKNIFGKGRIVPRAEVESIYEDSRGWLWLGTGYQGIAVVKNKDTFHFTKDNGLASNSNYFFYEDARGNIYTGGDGGFSKISFKDSAKKFFFENFYYEVGGDNLETFENCIAGPDGSLWLAGQQGIFHLINDSIIHYPVDAEQNLNVSDIKKDKEDNVWLATKGDGYMAVRF